MSHFGTDNDDGVRKSPERRREIRRRAFLKGKIVSLRDSFSTDCTIRDLSPGGARITVSAEAITADPCLIVVRDGVAHQSITVWRRGGQAGLRFQDTTDLHGAAPAHLRHIQRIWMELTPR